MFSASFAGVPGKSWPTCGGTGGFTLAGAAAGLGGPTSGSASEAPPVRAGAAAAEGAGDLAGAAETGKPIIETKRIVRLKNRRTQ